MYLLLSKQFLLNIISFSIKIKNEYFTWIFILFCRGVLQSLVEKHFPAPDRNRIKKLLGNVGIELKHSKVQNGDSQGPSGSGGSGSGKRKSGIDNLTKF